MFNAHSTMWDPRCTSRRKANFLKNLLRTFDLQVLIDGQAWKGGRRGGGRVQGGRAAPFTWARTSRLGDVRVGTAAVWWKEAHTAPQWSGRGEGGAPSRIEAGRMDRAIIEVCKRLTTRGSSVTLRWTSAHNGVEGNEVADDYAKEAAGNAWDVVDRRYLWEASLAQLARKTAEARAQGTR